MGMGKVIHDLYSNVFDSPRPLASSPSEGRWTCQSNGPPFRSHDMMSVKNRTPSGSNRVKPEPLEYLPPVLINSVARLFTRYLSEYTFPK
ncbi:hypothetical protein RB195_009667 [Necator americanus]|uniref:Uncharacterized protein n=1 Tax=Necator americanus TaxID=51031 RepID=A0ABR1CXP2_NECAM